MEDFLAILRMKPSVEDGTKDLVVPGTTPASNGHANAHVQACSGRGLSVKFKDVNFSYTEDRPVRSLSSRPCTTTYVFASTGKGLPAVCSCRDSVGVHTRWLCGLRFCWCGHWQVSRGAGLQILESLSFSVASGQRVAIVGPSGSGKSSTLQLIAALYSPNSGRITIAGQDVRDLRQASLRQHLAVVPQDTVLMNDSIMENIRYGRLEASDDEVRAAAQLAHLDPAIQRMPEGFDTMVGERGLKLSGGEKQRVAIARAFLRDPRLLVCDEATSALDSSSEQAIMRSLEELAEGRTSIFVAHRLSTVMNCDKIFVMADGKLVEQGTHRELMACGGVYAEMWELQAGEELARQDMAKWQQACVEDGLVAGLAAA